MNYPSCTLFQTKTFQSTPITSYFISTETLFATLIFSYCSLLIQKKEKTVEEVTSLSRKMGDGEEYFAVAHIFASFNDTFVHITDLSGRETLCRVTGMSSSFLF